MLGCLLFESFGKSIQHTGGWCSLPIRHKRARRVEIEKTTKLGRLSWLKAYRYGPLSSQKSLRNDWENLHLATDEDLKFLKKMRVTPTDQENIDVIKTLTFLHPTTWLQAYLGIIQWLLWRGIEIHNHSRLDERRPCIQRGAHWV